MNMDLEEIIKKEMEKEKTKNNNENKNNKDKKETQLKDIIENKKIKTIKTKIKERILVLIVVFSLVILILATSFYLVYYKSLSFVLEGKLKATEKINKNYNYEQNRFNKQKNSKEFNNLNFANSSEERDKRNDYKNNYEEMKPEILDQDNKTKTNETNIKAKIKKIVKIVENNCPNKSAECLANLAYKYTEPSFCLFSRKKEKDICLNIYRSKFIDKDYEKAKELAEKLLKGEINKEDIEKEGWDIPTLIYTTGDERLCKFLDNKSEISICNY